MSRRLVIEADGGARGNPGPAGYGALVTDGQTGEVLAERHESLGVTTNNVAEYSGLIAGLRAAAELAPGADVQVRMDSRLVVEQMSGNWKIKDANLRVLAASAREVSDQLGRVSYSWIPRAQNARADRLANQAMDAARDGVAHDGGAEVGGSQGSTGQGTGDQGSTGQGTGEQGSTGQGTGGRGGTGQGAAAQGARARAGGTPADGDSAPGGGAREQATRPGRAWGPARGRATTTLLLRHGQTPLSAERRFAGRGDIPLTETGRRQAAAAAARLAARGGIDVIVSSPLRRTRRTAEAVAEATGAPLVVDDDLVETDFGKWEGLSFAEAGAQDPDEMRAWMADPDAAPPDGESFATAGRRVLGALDRLLDAYPERTVLVVSHVTPIKTLLCRALLAPPAALFRIHLDVASLCEVDWFADGPAVVRSVNDTAHLR
ncbi:MAG TPA: bifunctional RNase H/acid phosphatase [Streptosporangiaceae bacterium]